MRLELTNRYNAMGIPEPDPETMCDGECEGTGVVLVPSDEMSEPWRSLWLEAEKEGSDHTGWHVVRCPDCNGTGKKGGA